MIYENIGTSPNRKPSLSDFLCKWQDNMRLIDNCTNCGHCKAHCPYGLDTPALLKRQQKEFFEMIGL